MKSSDIHIIAIPHEMPQPSITKICLKMTYNIATVLSLFNSLILPYATYCIHVWGWAYDTHVKQVLVLQNKALRVIADIPKGTNVNPIESFRVFFHPEAI